MLDHLLKEEFAALDVIEHLLGVRGAAQLIDHRLNVIDGEFFELESLEKLLRVAADVTRDHRGFIATVVFDLALHEWNTRVRLLDTGDLALEDVGNFDVGHNTIWFCCCCCY